MEKFGILDSESDSVTSLKVQMMPKMAPETKLADSTYEKLVEKNKERRRESVDLISRMEKLALSPANDDQADRKDKVVDVKPQVF